MSVKTINLEVLKLRKKHNLPLWNQPSFLHYWVMKLRFGHQPVASEQESLFHLPQCSILKTVPPRQLPKANEVEVESALPTISSSRASSLSSSHSSNIITLWWTVAVFQHCQNNILNKIIVRIFNIAFILKDTYTGKERKFI